VFLRIDCIREIASCVRSGIRQRREERGELNEVIKRLRRARGDNVRNVSGPNARLFLFRLRYFLLTRSSYCRNVVRLRLHHLTSAAISRNVIRDLCLLMDIATPERATLIGPKLTSRMTLLIHVYWRCVFFYYASPSFSGL
jgi:hypothetical protein